MDTQPTENEERRERILDAAESLITHYGYDKTTVSDIAREAGVSKGAIYLHFDSKDALFEALLMRETIAYSLRWGELIEADPQGGTFAGIYKSILYALQGSDFMMAIFKQDTRVIGSYIRKPDNALTRGRTSLRGAFVEAMQAVGAVRQDANPVLVAHIMDMLSFALVSMDEVKPTDEIPPFEDTIEAIGDMMGRAFEPEGGADSDAGKAVIRQMLKPIVEQMKNQTDETEEQ